MTPFNLTDLPGRLAALRAALPRGTRLIGLDPGRRVIGLALSDVGLMLASPLAQLPRAKLARNAGEIAALAKRHGAGGLVVGLPLGLDGSFGPAAQAARDWARALAEAARLPHALWDERLSSAAANRMLIGEMDATRAQRRAAVDQVAAAYMLQGALDASTPSPSDTATRMAV